MAARMAKHMIGVLGVRIIVCRCCCCLSALRYLGEGDVWFIKRFGVHTLYPSVDFVLLDMHHIRSTWQSGNLCTVNIYSVTSLVRKYLNQMPPVPLYHLSE